MLRIETTTAARQRRLATPQRRRRRRKQRTTPTAHHRQRNRIAAVERRTDELRTCTPNKPLHRRRLAVLLRMLLGFPSSLEITRHLLLFIRALPGPEKTLIRGRLPRSRNQRVENPYDDLVQKNHPDHRPQPCTPKHHFSSDPVPSPWRGIGCQQSIMTTTRHISAAATILPLYPQKYLKMN